MANGYILYEGKSSIDGAPIVVVATGFKAVSTNRKTGAVIQTYILRSDIDPQTAVKSGDDASICGVCPHRGDGTGKERSCYVNLGWGPRSVYAAYKNGKYPAVTIEEMPDLFAGKVVRLGSYGEPVAAPIEMWEAVTSKADSHLGYTHRFRDVSPDWAKLCMASADSVQDMDEAHALGYRTFRVAPVGEGPIKGREVVCPASEEAGKKTTCEDCRACGGTSAKAKISIQIAAHGTGKKYVDA